MSAAALIPTLLPLFMVAAFRRAEKRIYRQLTDAGAVTAESAIQLSLGRSMERRRLESLIRDGAVRLGQNGFHYLDVDGWNRHQSNRRRRVLFAASVVVALVGIALGAMWLTLWQPG